MGFKRRVVLILFGCILCIIVYLIYDDGETSEKVEEQVHSQLHPIDGEQQHLYESHHKEHELNHRRKAVQVNDRQPKKPYLKPLQNEYAPWNALLQETNVTVAVLHIERAVGESQTAQLPSEIVSLAQYAQTIPALVRHNNRTHIKKKKLKVKATDVGVGESFIGQSSSVGDPNDRRQEETTKPTNDMPLNQFDIGGKSNNIVKNRTLMLPSSGSLQNKLPLFGSDNSKDLDQWHIEQQNVIIDERRRIVEEKRQLMEDKIKFHQEISNIMNELRVGNMVDVHHKLVNNPRPKINASQWEGLNSTVIADKYPGLILLSEYKLVQPFVDPNDESAAGMQGQPQTLADMTDGQAEERFFQLLSKVHLDCIMIRRIGSLADGGWDLCTVQPYELTQDCLVYSFGINFDFAFDDAVSSKFGCTVKAFDPSMAMEDHIRSAKVHFYRLGLSDKNTVTSLGWKMMTLQSIRERLHHDKSVIDVLKIDIDYAEWKCFRNIITDGSLHKVKQLIFEIHTAEVQTVLRPTTALEFYHMYMTLKDLEQFGFRRYNVHMNPLGQYTSSRTGKTRSCCYELYYINIRFLV